MTAASVVVIGDVVVIGNVVAVGTIVVVGVVVVIPKVVVVIVLSAVCSQEESVSAKSSKTGKKYDLFTSHLLLSR